MRRPLFTLVALGALVTPALSDPARDLHDLGTEYWEWHLRENPGSATSLGDHRYNHLLSDISPEAREGRRVFLEDLRGRVERLFAEELSAADRVTRNALLYEIQSDLGRLECDLGSWVVDAGRGPQSGLFNYPSLQPFETDADAEALRSRWAAMGPYLRQHTENIRGGVASGRTPIRTAVVKTISQIDDILAQPVAEWSLLNPLENPPEHWSAGRTREFEEELTRIVKDDFKPALVDYREFLESEVLPESRPDTRPGLAYVDGGEDCYRNLVRLHTSLDLQPEEIHRIGLGEVARINAETRELGKKVLGADDLEAIHERLRSDPELHFETREEVHAKAEEALARARAAMGDWFGVLPEAPCEVVRIEPHEEKHTTIAYYRRPAADGSRPGRYYVNTYAPQTRPRYEAEALAYHEAIPGHHLQIAIAQELEGLPTFRKHGGTTAFVEGWGLYSERLSDEMGLYSDDLDRMGMLSYDSWRACRLVVDTGLHALGWSRQQAIDYMVANTCLAENNIVNEVDRYIARPGQALAYKLGQREFFRLRAMAREELGASFDIKRFHDVVLSQGAVDLETLRAMVEDYVREAKSE